MNQAWYKNIWTKTILLFLTVLSAGTVLASSYMAAAMAYTSTSLKDFLRPKQEKYLESATFEALFDSTVYNALSGVQAKSNFETNGVYDPDKLVDIANYYENNRIDGTNEGGVAYKLGELLDWRKKYINGDTRDGEPVVVCQKMDGSYYYYYINDFRMKLENHELFVEDISSISTFIGDLKAGEYPSGCGKTISDVAGNILYVDCWTYSGMLGEQYAPEGVSSLLDIVNEDARWNGQLQNLCIQLQSSLYALNTDWENYDNLSDLFKEGNTNFSYLWIDQKNQKILTNRGEWKEYGDYKTYLNEIEKENKGNPYCVLSNRLKDCKSNVENADLSVWKSYLQSNNGDVSADDLIFAATLDKELPIQDAFYLEKENYDKFNPNRALLIVVWVLSIVVLVTGFVWLTLIAGRKETDEELHLNGFDKVPTELAAAGVIAIWIAGSLLLIEFWWRAGDHVADAVSYYFATDMSADVYSLGRVFWSFVTGLWTGAWFWIGYLSLVRRIKGKILWTGSLAIRILAFSRRVWSNRTATAKICVTGVSLMFLHWVILLIYSDRIGKYYLVLLAAQVALFVWLLKMAMAKDRLKKGIREIAEGNVDYKISEDGLKGDYQKIASEINHIGDGLQQAVEKSMKDERLKTDLLANVSHDIKTPLTSIINYVDLLKRENLEDPKVQNYLNILEEKAQRLKQLTEDVVEASKVSSGNITLECMDLNLSELILQTEGEFQEKFADKKLEGVLHLPEEPAMVHVDGRRMWRILENIYNNAAKYAMPGTRVYEDLSINERQVIFSLKNVSEYPLNFSADELTERFIRGDVSRSTEGSGLGLSIAKTLTTLQGGNFELYLDGDLFRVTITFPRVMPLQDEKCSI